MHLFRRKRKPDPRNLADFPTLFGQTRIYDVRQDGGDVMRVLDVEGTWQSARYLGERSRDLAFRYHQRFAEVLTVRGLKGGRALMLGGGGFAFPTWLLGHDSAATVDVIEIDPDIIELAEQWMSLAELSADERGRLDILCTDAVSWLAARSKGDTPYDLVINDLFAAEAPARALMDVRGAELIHDALAPGGLYLANVVSALRGSRARPLRSVVAALGECFAHVHVLPLGADEPWTRDNNIVIASDHELAWLS